MNRENHDMAMLRAMESIANSLCKIAKLMEMREQREKEKEHFFEKCNEEHDGCKGCKYVNLMPEEEPCLNCKQNHTDRWRSDKE